MSKRLFAVLFCVFVIPACGGGGSSGGGVPAPVVLLSDDWASGPSMNWVILTPNATVDAGGGNPPPAMLLSPSGGNPCAEVTTASTFSTTGGLTVSIDVQLATDAAIVIVNNASPSPFNTFVSIGSTNALYSINGQTAFINQMTDTSFHRYTFTVDRWIGGIASWKRDGVTQLTSSYSVQTVRVNLSNCQNGTNTHFDNALITTP